LLAGLLTGVPGFKLLDLLCQAGQSW